MSPTLLDRETVYAGYLTVERLQFELGDGTKLWREVERHGNAASVLPYDDGRRCALVARLFRAPVFEASGAPWLEEACAGMIDVEDAESAARREAGEELGVALGKLELIMQVWSSPGVSTERQSLFLAPYSSADRRDRGGGARGEHEGIVVVERPLATLAADLDLGRITDSKLALLVYGLLRRRPDLFAAIT